ncbi:MAG TPA: hypothetical protein VKX16_15240 [Chloroflexota bacterium]|nr:hypothetical protein [Chloroflexota bacterium]
MNYLDAILPFLVFLGLRTRYWVIIIVVVIVVIALLYWVQRRQT